MQRTYLTYCGVLLVAGCGDALLAGHELCEVTADPDCPPDQATPGSELEIDRRCDSSFPVRSWPVAAPTATCANVKGVVLPATGPDSADWFVYMGCGSWKEFEGTAQRVVRIRSRGDGCIGCVLWHVGYEVQEYDAGESRWVTTDTNDPEPDYRGMEDDFDYTPTSTRFRIQATGGFYAAVCELRE